MNPLDDFLALLDGLSDVTAVENIEDTITQVTDAANELAQDDTLDRDALLAALTRAAEITEALRTEGTARVEAEAEHQRQLADQLARINGPGADLSELDGLDEATLDALAELAEAGLTAELSADPDAGDGGGEGGDDPEGGDGSGGDDGGSGGGDGGEGAVNASGTRRISNVNARRPRGAQPRTSTPPVALSAMDGLVGVKAGTRLDDPEKMHRAVMAAARTIGSGASRDFPIAMSASTFSDGRTLRNTDAGHNQRTIQRAQRELQLAGGLEALNASGGPCAPGVTLYDQPVLGSAARPVRDGGLVMRMGAERGSIRTMPIPTLKQVTEADDRGGVGVWNDTDGATEDEDEEKPVAVIECDDPSEYTEVVAITKRLKYSEFRSRFFPESVEAWMSLLSTEHARKAETRELTKIGDGSTHVTMGSELSSTRDILRGVGKQVAQFRDRHRTPDDFRLRLGLPRWLRAHLREDLAAAAAAGTTDERLAYADAYIENFFEVRGVNPSWFWDGETGQVHDAVQTAGADLPWKSTVVGYLYPDGSWLHPESPELVIGVYRDHRWIGTNDLGFFAETFEATHFHGVESQRLVFALDPNGQGYGPIDQAAS